jgi:glycosyltransferase involved in cell wall biosynthesis
MRVLVLPSWCPTPNAPSSGSFFFEQAHLLAMARPDWSVAICAFDLAASRLPWRPWLLPKFFLGAQGRPRLEHTVAGSGLHEYAVGATFLPGLGAERKWEVNAAALASQVRPALTDFVRRVGRPHLIHAHAVYPGGVAAVELGREYGIPVALTEHLGPFPPATLCRADGQPMPLVARTYAAASGHSAVSRTLADRIVGLGLACDVEVIPNFLPDDYGADAAGTRAKGDTFSFLSVGGPSHEKGTDVLLRAFARCGRDVMLRVVGDGPERPRLQQLAVDLGIADRVRWLGQLPRSSIAEVYGDCDAFVLPSRGETFGVAFIEALACGKPLIATRCGGPEDIVHAGNGLLVPVDDVEALAVALTRMRRESMDYSPEKLRQDFHTRFSASAVVNDIEKWYSRILRKVPRGDGQAN